MPPERQSQPSQTPPPPPNQNAGGIAPIHTYKSDVASFIKTEGKTLADIAIAEGARHSSYLAKEATEPVVAKRAITIVLVIVILIALSTGVIWVSSLGKSGAGQPAPKQNSAPAIFISGIDEETLSIDNSNQKNALNSITSALKQTSPFLILNITTKNTDGANISVSSRNFFDKVGIYPPADLLHSLSEQFALGSIGGKSRFMILKTNYYAGAFAGMLKWEKASASIENDLRNLLDLPIPNNSGIVTEKSGTTTTLVSINQSGFTDAVISNRDARVLKDGKGAIILIYLFPDNNSIVVADSENTAKIVTEKLLRSKTK